jgi:hypothetical protein
MEEGMASTSSPRAAVSDEELGRLLALMKDSDSVEVKVTVPESDHRSAVDSLGLDPLAAQIRQIYFFDTPELALNESGVVARARRVQGKGDDSVVKLRPVVPADLPEDLRRSAGFFVEVDAMPGGFICSASMRGTPGKNDIRATIARGLPIRKLFSREQREFYAAHAPEDLGLDDLTVFGPIFVLKLRLTPEELDGRRLVAEMWQYPDGSRLLELSAKCTPAEGFQVAAEVRAYLGERGVDLSGEQETKTKKALEYFAAIARDKTP